MLVELAGQPFMAVQTDLNDERKPRLNANMHQSEVPIQKIEVITQTLASRIDQLRSLGLLLHELAEILDEQSLPTEQSLHGIGPANREKAAAILWRNEIKGFKYWFGAHNDATIARLMQELTDKGMQQFVSELAVELQVNHP